MLGRGFLSYETEVAEPDAALFQSPLFQTTAKAITTAIALEDKKLAIQLTSLLTPQLTFKSIVEQVPELTVYMVKEASNLAITGNKLMIDIAN